MKLSYKNQIALPWKWKRQNPITLDTFKSLNDMNEVSSKDLINKSQTSVARKINLDITSRNTTPFDDNSLRIL